MQTNRLNTMLSIYNFLKVKLCYRTYWKQWVAFLTLCFLVFACSSDDSTSSNSSQNFLEKYDSVIWKSNDDDINVSKGLWHIFTPDGWEDTSYGYVETGVCETYYIPWNIVGNYGDWIKAEVIDNSVDELIIEITETDSETYLIYITAINNGNSLHYTSSLSDEEIYYTRDTTSNICN